MRETISARVSNAGKSKKLKLFLNFTKSQVEQFELDKNQYCSVKKKDHGQYIFKFHPNPVPKETQKHKVVLNRTHSEIKGAIIALDPVSYPVSNAKQLGMEFSITPSANGMIIDMVTKPAENKTLAEVKQIVKTPVSSWGENLEYEVSCEMAKRIDSYMKAKYASI